MKIVVGSAMCPDRSLSAAVSVSPILMPHGQAVEQRPFELHLPATLSFRRGLAGHPTPKLGWVAGL